MPFTIVRQDITKMKVDAIVNAANTELLMGGGVCGAIFRAAGEREMQEACLKAAPIKTGGAAITPGFALPAKYVIHAAGPVYNHKDKERCEKLLRSAYTESLELAAENNCGSIAFPLISSGIYGYPKAEALAAATAAITDFLAEHDMEVYLAVFDKDSFAVSEQLMGEVASYIDEHYIGARIAECRQLLDVEKRSIAGAPAPDSAAPPAGEAPAALSEEDEGVLGADAPAMAKRKAMSWGKAAPRSMRRTPRSLDDIVGHLDEPFSDTLLALIDKKGKTDAEVYKKANIDRKLFSKIRTVKGYTPKKPTILALAVALELTLYETENLLKRAGYALSHASKFDVIVEYFIISGRYNIFEINEVLFKYDQPLLGG